MKINSKARTLKKLDIQGINIPKLKIYSTKNFIFSEERILKDINKSLSQILQFVHLHMRRIKLISRMQVNIKFLNVDSKNVKM